MLVVLSIFDSQAVRMTAEILAIALVPTVAFLTIRLLAAEDALGSALGRALDAEAERDQFEAELAFSRERLAEARQAAGRAQAAVEREVRLKTVLGERTFAGDRHEMREPSIDEPGQGFERPL